MTTSGIWELGSEVDPVGFEPGDLNKRADVVTELGLQPEEFLVQLVDSQGGRLPQRAFRDYTSWSETLISRVLQDMEDEGKIVRVRRGKEKVVCLPDHVPASGLGSPPGRDDPSPA